MLALLILWSFQASAATVFGTIYDFSLQQTENVRVSINTTPEQQLIAVNGRYSFNVPQGDYTLYAEKLEFGKIVSSASEEVTIQEEGTYIRDIVLFPYFEIINETEAITVEDVQRDTPTNTLVIALLILIAFLLIFILFRMKKVLSSIRAMMFHTKEGEKKENVKKQIADKQALPNDLQEIVDFIKSKENRVTQKDIRKQFPQSEAKISLLIADLEKRGLVEKIKKGRGNIVILKS